MNYNYYTNEMKKYQKKLNSLKGNKEKSPYDINKSQAITDKYLSSLNASKLQEQVSASDLNAKTQSYLAQQQALKYMPGQLARQGLGTTGLSETSNANIRNAYLNQIANQNINTQNLSGGILSSYQQNLANIDQNLLQRNLELDAQEQEKQNQYLDYYLQALSMATTKKEFDNYLKYARQYLNDKNYNALVNDLELIDYYKNLSTYAPAGNQKPTPVDTEQVANVGKKGYDPFGNKIVDPDKSAISITKKTLADIFPTKRRK